MQRLHLLALQTDICHDANFVIICGTPGAPFNNMDQLYSQHG